MTNKKNDLSYDHREINSLTLVEKFWHVHQEIITELFC